MANTLAHAEARDPHVPLVRIRAEELAAPSERFPDVLKVTAVGLSWRQANPAVAVGADATSAEALSRAEEPEAMPR